MPRVFDKAITINVSVPIHPFQRHLDVRPEMFQEAEVASTLVICCRKHHEQRRGINASVIATEGDFTEVRHFALAHLVQNLSRLCLDRRLRFECLRRSQELQDSLRDPRTNPQHFKRRDDAVAPEYRAKPRNSGIRIVRLRIANRHHFNISGRAFNPIVEAIIGAGDEA